MAGGFWRPPWADPCICVRRAQLEWAWADRATDAVFSVAGDLGQRCGPFQLKALMMCFPGDLDLDGSRGQLTLL
jgi:hypothetical protein